MKVFLFLLAISITLSGFGQDNKKLAQDLQLKYKESEIAILQAINTYEFIKDTKVAAKILESKSRKLLSLRYNYSIPQTEVYDNNSQIERFFGDSNLKQKAEDGAQLCGTYTTEGYFYDDSKFCSHLLKLKEVGEVWNINVVKKINDPKYITSIYFQEKFPLIEKKIKFIIPL